jgi:hypothetical protein
MRHRAQNHDNHSDTAALAAVYASPDSIHRFKFAGILSDEGNHAEARRLYATIDTSQVDATLRAEAINSIAVLDGLEERHHASRAGFRRALAIDPACENARRNLAMLEACGCGAEDDETGQ